MKKIVSLLLSIIITFSFITEIPVYAASNTNNTTYILEPFEFTDETEALYTISISAKQETKKFLWIKKSFVSYFNIEATKKSDDTQTIYKYEKEYKLWFIAPNSIEKAFKRNKLSYLYTHFLEFQSIDKMYEENAITDFSNDNKEIIEKLINDYSEYVLDKIKPLPDDKKEFETELATATLNKICEHFNVNNFDYFKDFFEKIKESCSVAKKICEEVLKISDIYLNEYKNSKAYFDVMIYPYIEDI